MRAARRLPAISFALASALAVAPSASKACAPPPCYPGYGAPADGASIPASAPGLPCVLPRSSFGAAQIPPPELRADDGTLLETTTSMEGGVLLLAPRAPLAVGSGYRLRLPDFCPPYDPPDGGVALREQRFTVTAATPSPTSLGVVKPGATSVGMRRVFTSSGSCTEEIRAAILPLAFQPSADLSPYLPVARMTVTVDGNEWATSAYGEVRADGTLVSPPPGELSGDGHHALQLFAACDRSASAGADQGLTLGQHHVEVRAHIAGSASDPPTVSLDVALSCDGEAGDGGLASPGGCACHAGGRPIPPASAMLAVILLAGALLRPRRR